jgi:hypothetical protein
MIFMPGRSYRGPLPPMTQEEIELRDKLFKHVDLLAGVIGERNIYTPGTLESSIAYISKLWRNLGYVVEELPYEVNGKTVKNLEVRLDGEGKLRDEIIVIGAHYDTPPRVPGANDNASGVAAVLEISRLLRDKPRARTIRSVAFVNEEPPFFQSPSMGSFVYAKRCHDRGDKIVGMFTPETIGFYSDEPNSQQYPGPLAMLYPNVGNFIAFVGDISSRKLVKDCVRSFRSHTKFPSEGGAAPASIPGIGWSDHWSFWQFGYPALMVTDTAPYRYRHYHTPQDTPEEIDYEKTARVVAGLARVALDLATKT